MVKKSNSIILTSEGMIEYFHHPFCEAGTVEAERGLLSQSAVAQDNAAPPRWLSRYLAQIPTNTEPKKLGKFRHHQRRAQEHLRLIGQKRGLAGWLRKVRGDLEVLRCVLAS